VTNTRTGRARSRTLTPGDDVGRAGWDWG